MTKRPDLLDAAAAVDRPDMTPMIDVVFLMIIFFLCIEFKVLEAKLSAFLPKDHGGGAEWVEAKEQLSVRVECVAAGERRHAGTGQQGRYRLDGHQVQWSVGPVAVTSVAALHAELARVAELPSSRVYDPKTGRRELVECVIEPQPGVCYADVAQATDAAYASGFTAITFGGVRGARSR